MSAWIIKLPQVSSHLSEQPESCNAHQLPRHNTCIYRQSLILWQTYKHCAQSRFHLLNILKGYRRYSNWWNSNLDYAVLMSFESSPHRLLWYLHVLWATIMPKWVCCSMHNIIRRLSQFGVGKPHCTYAFDFIVFGNSGNKKSAEGRWWVLHRGCVAMSRWWVSWYSVA